MKNSEPISVAEANAMSSLALAHVGDAVKRLLPLLTEEETAVYKRGRNSRVHGVPAHANPGEYHSATGLEALLGWLYLTGRQDRIRALFDAVTED